MLNSRESMSTTRFAMIGVLCRRYCSVATSSRPMLPSARAPNAGRRYLSRVYRHPLAVDGLQRTATCSFMYRSATSAILGPASGGDWGRAGSSPALMLAMNCAALRRACSADSTPCRPMVTRLDLPPNGSARDRPSFPTDTRARRTPKAHGPRRPPLAHRRAVPRPSAWRWLCRSISPSFSPSASNSS